MKTSLDCVPCFLRQALEVARMATPDVHLHEQLLREILRDVGGMDLAQPPPLMGRHIHRRLRELTGQADPYLRLKQRFNALALRLLPRLEARLRADADPLLLAVRLAIAGNIIDNGVNAALGEPEVLEALDRVLHEPFAGDVEAFREAAAGARRILYLADNAGEIVLDRLLVTELGPDRVTLVVRGSPTINDATREDAQAAGLDRLVEVIDNGADVPGTALAACSPELRRRFREADLVIAKGQGNYETLSDEPAPLFFLLKVKCPVIASHLRLPLGTHVLRRRGAGTGPSAPAVVGSCRVGGA